MSNSVFHRLKKLGTRPKTENTKVPYDTKDFSYQGSHSRTDHDQALSSFSEARTLINNPEHTSIANSPKPSHNDFDDSDAHRRHGAAELDSTQIPSRPAPLTTVSASRQQPPELHQLRASNPAPATTNNVPDVDSWITPALLNIRTSPARSVPSPETRLSPSSTLFPRIVPGLPAAPEPGGHSMSYDAPIPIGWEGLEVVEAPTTAAPTTSASSSRIGRTSVGASIGAAREPVEVPGSKTEDSTQYNPPSIVIIVMGLTGAGKSRFVKEATGLNVDVGHSLVSATADITPYEISFGTRYGFLIDTPGFDDTYRTDVEIFRDVADWLARQYASHELLTSIIYVHRITDSRVAGSALRNLTVMKKMLGVESFRNLVLVTSMWDLVDPAVGEQREKELSNHFWKDLVRAGATMQRFAGDKQSAMRILTAMRSEAPVTLTIQRELVDDGLQLDRTTAGTYLERELLRTNAQESTDVYQHAQQLNEASEQNRRSSTPQSQTIRNSTGRNNTLLKAYWSAGSRTLSQGSTPATQHRRDPEMYVPFAWENDFRLVSLRAGSGASPIEISLVMADAEDPPEFVALSYVVGREPADAAINFRRDRWLSQLYITANLREALQNLRLPDTDLLIWVDAISVNQDDLDERARQVRMMSQIFRAAQGVCIWLGSSDDGGNVAMDFIADILDFSLLENLVKDGEHQEKWLLLAKLMSRPWFRRRWVVQEIMFAQDATVHCGDRVVTWTDFRDAATLFRTKWPDIQQHMNEAALLELGDAHLLGAIALIEVAQTVFRRDADGNILEKLLTTEDLVSRLPMFEVSDILDTVYGVLDMANDMTGANAVQVNYEQQPAELFRDTIKLIVESSGSLDIICRPWAPKSGLPSWITTVSKHMYKRRVNSQQYDRQNGISLVGLPGNTIYRACGIMRATSENTSFRAEGDQQVLAVTGQYIGRIEELGDKTRNGTIPQEWMELAGWRSLEEPVPVSFWRTLVANRASDGSPAPDWYGRACEFGFRKSTTEDINITALIRTSPSSHVQHFLNRVLDVTWRRTFALVKDGNNTFCALCPPETVLDDIVCILYGCSVPVVLRRVVSYYQIIGECFVYGIMDGEAINSNSGQASKYDII